MDGNGKVDFVLSSSDGSMSMFELEHCTDETFGSLGQFKELELEWTVQDDPVVTVEVVDKDGTTPFSDAKSTLGGQTMTGSAFGGGLGGGTTTVFGQTSSLGFSSSPFGVKSSGDQQKPSLSFGSPTFGLSSAKPGEFSLAPTATNNTVTQELSTIEKSAPIFGSALKGTNAFGNVSNSLASNEFKAASPMGFASLAANAKEKVGFGTTTDTKAPIDIHGTLSKTIDGESGQRGENVRLVKSFSESESSEASIEVHSDTKFSDTGSVVHVNSNELHDQLTKEGQLAARAFDDFDDDKQGKIPIGKLESLLDEIGEGFHGDEFDKQLDLLDPSSSGFIDRKSFISWYCHLGEVSDHDGSSLDSDERNEREEEKTKAMNAFDSVAADGVLLHKSEFGKLMEKMGTTYCEEEHVQTVRKISDSNGNISKESFVNWYMDWLFGDGDGDESEASEGVESDAINDSCKAEAKPEASAKGWGDTFTIDKDSWKCNACMLLNKGSVATCVACETVRPGHQHVNESGGQPREQTEAEGKFLFSAQGTGDTKGFSFGFTPTPEESKRGGSGFTFGFSSPLEPSKATSKSSISFGFNSTSNDETSRQNEDIKESSIALVDEKSTSGSTTDKPSSGSGFPPMATKAPTPFESSAVKPTTDKPSSGSGFPPMATKAPTPFGSSTVKMTEKPSSGSGFPPYGDEGYDSVWVIYCEDDGEIEQWIRISPYGDEGSDSVWIIYCEDDGEIEQWIRISPYGDEGSDSVWIIYCEDD
jgi:Ca2+-binding protein (EF-Hand superfamily)